MSSSDRPRLLGPVDRYFAAAMIAHEYVSDLHRELVELDAADDHTRELLRESAAVISERMPSLIRRWRSLMREWAEQELLDPQAAKCTAELLEDELTELVPALAALHAQQKEVVAELLDRIDRAR